MTKKKRYIQDAPRFGRQWWLAALRNFLWVALVTALVWVYADMEFTVTEEFRATLHLTTGKAENLALMSKPDIEVSFKVQGNRSGLTALGQWLKDHGAVIPFDVAEGYKIGTNSVPMQNILETAASLSRRGLSFVSAQPGTAGFELDKIIQVADVPVEFDYVKNVTVEKDKVKITPPKIGIRVPESRWKEILKALPDESLRKLKTHQEDLKDRQPGEPIALPRVEVLPLLAGLPVTPDREDVRVEVQIEQVIVNKIFTVTPRLQMPVNWVEDNTWTDYKFTRKPDESWIKEIKVAGSKNDVDSLKAEDIDAYVTLRDDDKKPVSWLTRDVMVRFPPKLRVELIGEKPTVSFKLEKRIAPAVP